MENKSLLQEWWGALSVFGKVTIVTAFIAVLWSVLLPLMYPEAPLENFLKAMVVLAFLLVGVYAVTRHSLAESRLSDPEYFFDKK